MPFDSDLQRYIAISGVIAGNKNAKDGQDRQTFEIKKCNDTEYARFNDTIDLFLRPNSFCIKD